MRYIGADGRFLSRQTVRGAIDQTLDNAARSMRTLSEQLRDGRISLADWQIGMRRNVKSIHMTSTAAARGGWAQITLSEQARAGAILRDQYALLNRFAGQIRTGAIPLDGRFLQRTTLYSEMGRFSYHQTERRMMEERGFSEERNVLASSDHCVGCLEADAMGWVPVGELPAVGRRDCMARCRCHIEFRNPATGALAA